MGQRAFKLDSVTPEQRLADDAAKMRANRENAQRNARLRREVARKAGFQDMTFTLHIEQLEKIKLLQACAGLSNKSDALTRLLNAAFASSEIKEELGL